MFVFACIYVAAESVRRIPKLFFKINIFVPLGSNINRFVRRLLSRCLNSFFHLLRQRIDFVQETSPNLFEA